MNRWLRCLGVSFLALTILSFPGLTQEKTALGISDMITLAISNNMNFQKALLQLKNIEIDTLQLEAENLLTKSEILAKQKEINLLQQKDTFQNQKDQLIIQAVDNYFRLMLAEKDIVRKRKNAELEKSILTEVEAQVAAGYSVDLALLQQGNTYYNARFSYEKAKLDYEQLLIEIKDNLGINHNTNLSVKIMEMTHLAEIDLPTALAKARENSASIKSKEIEVGLANIRLEEAKINRESQLEIAKLENNLKVAELEESILKQDLDFQIQTQWQNHRQSKNDILLSEQSLKQMQENETTIRRQVEAGLRTDGELLSATIGVLDAEYRLISSFRQYYQSHLELKRIMGMLEEGEIR